MTEPLKTKAKNNKFVLIHLQYLKSYRIHFDGNVNANEIKEQEI